MTRRTVSNEMSFMEAPQRSMFWSELRELTLLCVFLLILLSASVGLAALIVMQTSLN
jgi:hypothetical protein